MPTMKRVRCNACRRFRWPDTPCRCLRPTRFHVPDVDGTLGTEFERQNGGPQLDSFGDIKTHWFAEFQRYRRGE